MTDTHDATLTEESTRPGRIEPRLECPHCFQSCELAETIQCGRCGAYLQLQTKTTVPPTHDD